MTCRTDVDLILIVDNDTDRRRSAAGMLRQADLPAREAGCMDEAMQLVESAPPLAALVHVQALPARSADPIRRLRLASQGGPILAVAPAEQYRTLAAMVDPWFDDLLLTPACEHLWVRTVRCLIERAQLRAELAESRRTAEALQCRLAEKQHAMHEVLQSVESYRQDLGRQVISNLHRAVLPVLGELRQGLSRRQADLADQLEAAIEEVASPFIHQLTQAYPDLTPTELRICAYLRRGLSSKEIARIESVATGTVSRHREAIRRKLGLVNTAANLPSFLRRFEQHDDTTGGEA